LGFYTWSYHRFRRVELSMVQRAQLHCNHGVFCTAILAVPPGGPLGWHKKPHTNTDKQGTQKKWLGRGES